MQSHTVPDPTLTHLGLHLFNLLDLETRLSDTLSTHEPLTIRNTQPDVKYPISDTTGSDP